MENCLFCKMIHGEIPVAKVYEDEQLIVIKDINPVAPVHLLLIPRRHTENCLDLSPDDNALIGHVFQVAARLARDLGVADHGFRVVNNNNAGAGQSVFHIHFHLLAGRDLHWPPG